MAAAAQETVLMQNDAFRLTTHRLVQQGLEAEITAEGNLRISAHGQERLVEIPGKPALECAAYHGSIPVLGAMYNLAIQELSDDITPNGHMLAGANWSSVWTRDIAYAVALGAAVAAPEACRVSLDSRVKHGVVMQDTGTGGGWPVSTDRVSWALGVWALFKVTGDRDWLEHCANVLQATLEQDAAVLPPHSVLRPGETSFIDWREQSYPDWMTPADIGSSYAFGTNVLHYICRQILARMLHLLGRKKEAKPYEEQAARLADAILENFWNKGSRQFGIMRLANGYRDERTDTLATALAVLCGLAGKHALHALNHLPRSPWGTPVFSPYKISQRDAYHNRAVWPFVEAYVMLAHAELQDTAGAGRSMSHLLRACLAFGTNKENFNAATGEQGGTILNSDRQLWSVSGMLGLFYHGLFGLQYEKENLVIAPCVPREYRGSHWLTGLRIRNMVLDIHLNGYGTEIASAMINGKPGSPIIPLNAEGRFQVELELLPGGDDEAPAEPPAAMDDLPEPEWDSPAPAMLRWKPVPGAVSYRVFRNGTALAATADCCLPINGTAPYTEYQVQAVSTLTASCLSRPFEVTAPGAKVKLVPFRIGENAEFPVEHGRAWLDTRPCTARLDYMDTYLPAGIYRVRVRYCNATASLRDADTCALRELEVDGLPRGIMVLPHNTEAGQWEDYTLTAPLTLPLAEGRHVFSLRYTPQCVNANGSTNQCMVQELIVTRIK
ncbi:MAG: hypothetical protein Q4C88_01380 [Akkermansia sp.]|nr:hypothetical protein [Akkermansia sp.]